MCDHATNTCQKFDGCNSGYCPLRNDGCHKKGDTVCMMLTKAAKYGLEAIPVHIAEVLVALKTKPSLGADYNRYLKRI